MAGAQRTFCLSIYKLCITLSVLAWQEVLACDTKLPAVGPRLFRAKAQFGEVMKLCHREFAAAAKDFPSEKLRKATDAYCHMLNLCKDSIPEKTTKMVQECIEAHVLNKTGSLYSEVGLPYSFAAKINRILRCFHDHNLTSVPLEVTVDATSFARWAAINFGWN